MQHSTEYMIHWASLQVEILPHPLSFVTCCILNSECSVIPQNRTQKLHVEIERYNTVIKSGNNWAVTMG